MANMFKQLRQAANKLGDMVGIQTMSSQQAGGEVDPLDEARARVDALRGSMEGMKATLVQYSRHLLTFSSSASHVSQEWAGLYSHSPARSNSLQSFTSNQTRIEMVGLRLYKENYGWDILKVFDDWEGDAAKMLQDIDKTEKARTQVSNLDEKVRSLRAAKDRRAKRGESADAKSEQQLESHEAMLEKYTVMLSNMRVNLDKNLTNFFEQRFATLDKAFVRFMEIQIEFFKEGAAASANYQTIVDNYRRRFPRAQTGQYGPTPDAASPIAVRTNGDPDLLNGHSSSAAPHPQPQRARSTPPQQEDVRGDDRPAQQQQQQARPPQQRTPAPVATRQAAAPAADADDSSDSSSGSDSDSDSSDSDDETPHAAPPKKHHHGHHAHSHTEPVIDLFDFPASPPAAKPAPAASPAPPKEADLSDFFGAPSTSVAAPAAAAAKVKPAPQASEFDFDFLGGGSHANATAASASGSRLPQSSSSPALKSNLPAAARKKDDLHSFDPFGMTSPANKVSAPPAAAPRVRSASPPPAPPGTSQSGLVNAYVPPTHKLDDHIAEQQAQKVAELRAAEDEAESALEARREAETGLEGSLSAWENNKDGNKKNVRNLLSSVHTVLWANSGWKPISFADLIDFNAIKKAHMKVIRVVHPDRLTDATPEQMVIALRVFDVLNQAFERFKETGQ